MPQQRRFRRLGKATTAVSVGALTLVIMGSAAPPAVAGTRQAASAPCPKPVDPASTIKHWQCRLGKIRDQIFPPKKTPAKPARPAKPAPKPKPDPEKKKPRTNTPSNLTPQSPGGGTTGGPTAYSQSGSLRPYTGAAPGLPGLLPAPQVAADGGAYAGQPGLADTRLIAPVASSEPTGGDQMLWVALASGTAGAVGAMNISVLGRRVRRRRPQN